MDLLPHIAVEQALYKQLPSPVVLNMGNDHVHVNRATCRNIPVRNYKM